MTALWLRVRAPFAAFRWMQAGVYRATSPTIPPSAAWGLLLNLAGVETREPATPTTLIRADAPPLCIAVGMLGSPERVTLYQQLHTYPVGNSGEKDLKPRTRGAKYWITPARRELLVDFDCQLGVKAQDEGLLEQIVDGLTGNAAGPRYGLPFAGDNNFLVDRIDVLDEPLPACWFEAMHEDEGPRRNSCRLTVGIDRGDASRTTSVLFAPTEVRADPPSAAWTWTPRLPDLGQ